MAVPATMPIEGLRPVRYAEACVRGDARRGGRRDRHHGRLPRPALAAHGPALRQGARAVRPVLVRGTVLARERRRPRRDPAGRHHADRHRRAAGRPARVSRAVRTARVQRHPARHHALRRLERGTADRRDGRGLSRGHRAAQSARPGEHRGVARVRLRHAQLHHLRSRAPGRALAPGRGARRLHRRAQGPHRAPEPAPGLGHRDQRSRSARSIRSSRRSCCASSTPTAAWAIGNARRQSKRFAFFTLAPRGTGWRAQRAG